LPSVLDLESAIRERAPAFAKAILQAAAATKDNEAEFRSRAYTHIKEFSDEYELDLQPREEYTLFGGRADAVYNRLVIEYEPPGSLHERPDRLANRHATDQVKTYLNGLVRRERHKPERLAGVAFDGHWLIFVMHQMSGWLVEDPVPVDPSSCERLLSLLASLNLDRAVQPEYLIKDFGENSPVARKVVSTLYDSLTKTEVPFVKVMFEQWSMQFGQVCDYDSASKLDLTTEAARFAVKGDSIDPFKFFFCLHTYYATFIKLLALQIAQFYLMPKLGTNLRQVASHDEAKLKAFMDKLERGGVFKDFGIANFLEGDFFKWYVEAWDTNVFEAIRQMIATLANYSLVTLDANPNVTRDILKVLYQGLVPKKLRHNLGEHYTADWLAERLVKMTVIGHLKPTDRVLDPACGSGTFLIICIRMMIEYARKMMLPESEVLDKILLNVVGFDLNPLAVITARTNYLLALADKRYDMLSNRKTDISIPVYLCDSVVTPTEGGDIFGKDRFKIKTAVGEFVLPKSIIRRDLIKRMADVLEELVEIEVDRDACIERLASELKLDREKNAVDLGLLADLYEQLLDKKKHHINGVWARVIKNAFAPLFLRNFDYIVGNPPWVNWESLPEKYRIEEVVPLFQDKYGLFLHKGLRARHGSTKIDISALMTYVVADICLKRDGRLGFLITQSVFKTDAGKGFRKFALPDGTPLGIVHVDDMTAFQPFEGATNRTAAFVLQKGKNTEYKSTGARFTYWMWLKKEGKTGSLPQDATWSDIEDKVSFHRFVAEPVDEGDPTSQWLTGRPLAVKAVRRVLGSSDYGAHEGCNSGGANGVYWVSIVGERPDGLVVVANITEGAKRQVDSVQAPVERDLLYPLLRGRDVSRWCATPSAFIITPQSQEDRKHGIPLSSMKANYAKTVQYLERFSQLLESRPAYIKFLMHEPYYALYDIKNYTFAPWKVVWTRVATDIGAAVAGSAPVVREKKCIVPAETATLVAFDSSREAHYVCAAINSKPFRYAVISYSVDSTGGFGSPHILTRVRVPKFDPKDKVHLRLAELSEQAHKVAAKLERDQMKESPEIKAIEEEVDQCAAKLWTLSDKERREIKSALEELR
jgi:SAM-dependent methyltransferase